MLASTHMCKDDKECLTILLLQYQYVVYKALPKRTPLTTPCTQYMASIHPTHKNEQGSHMSSSKYTTVWKTWGDRCS